ncbi:MAG: hypothetical protein V3T58_06135 [Candidatus Hydrothermarchaeales archaeon]
MKLREFRLRELPPEEHPIGIYAGLAIGAFILGVGTLVLFRDMTIAFKKEGLKITLVWIFRLLLMLTSAYASLACAIGLFRLIGLQKTLVRKVDKEFRDFVMYARPLVEEIIRQRIIGEKIIESLDKFRSYREMEGEKLRFEEREPPMTLGFPRWGEFLLFVALLSNISIGLFLYSIDFPWRLVPYSVIILAVMWWVVMAKYFGLLLDIRSYYLPAIFILVMPSLSIILRAYILPFQAVYVVFLIMFIYILVMYLHYNYLITGRLPEFVTAGPTMVKELKASLTREVDKSVPSKLREYLPEKPKEHEERVEWTEGAKALFKRIRDRLRRVR